MRISVFTTMKDPEKRGDLYKQAIESYDFADEIIVIDGGSHAKNGSTSRQYGKWRKITHWWPKEFSWEFIGQQFNRGYEACSGDVVIHADLDFIFHEKDYTAIREACQRMLDTKSPAMSFYKFQFILPDRYTLKSRLVIAVNKRDFGDRIKFNSGGDLCQPSLDGKELKPDDVVEAQVPFYNYEKILKTREQIEEDVGRMARAWYRHFGTYKLGGPSDASAFDEWLKMTVGRFYGRSHEFIPIQDHPRCMQDTIKDLRPHQWGYDGLSYLERNNYA